MFAVASGGMSGSSSSDLHGIQRRPSFPAGGFEWSGGRRKSSFGRLRKNSSTMTDLIDDEEPSENVPPICDCKCGLRITDETLPDRNQNSRSDDIIHEDVCSCQNSKPKYTANKKRRRGGSKDTVKMNIGGHIFETYRSTLRRLKNSMLANDEKLKLYYRPESGDYFFDRDPTAFAAVLNYLRSGELHIPTNMCGPSLQNELVFWGIDELDIERCCWTNYNTWKTQCRSLEKLEYDRKLSTTQNIILNKHNSTCWQRYRSKIWTFLQDPTSSRIAKIYAWVSIIFVLLSIFSFCAETHPMFRVKPQEIESKSMQKIYEFLNMDKYDWPNQSGTVILDHQNITNANLTSPEEATVSEPVVEPDLLYDNGEEDYFDEETYRERKRKTLPHPSLVVIDLSCLFFFSLEFISRFVCSPSKIKFMRSLQNIIDMVAIIPDYIEMIFLMFDPIGRKGMVIMDFMIILRMLRLCRIFRLIRHVPGLWIMLYTLKASFNELMLMCVFLLIGMVVFASLMHFAEGNEGYDNIPIGFWWSIVTMTTVGYGDMYPQTGFGYIIGSLCAIAGLLTIAFTVPIIVSNFVLYYTHVQYGLARREKDVERMQESAKDEEEGKYVNNSFRTTRTFSDSAAIELGETIALTSNSDDKNSKCV
ncbi:potassium voltage-gated channel subfamily C member 1 isoform X2 [Patella vulgata]|uniref:potassium voltage-gated channel subfamily C member 1 isoform X2 n=1 Tax=Patella vulgata TaxID=6465 RepID=UPI0021802EB9|nr:potassium voltage-gated channel subfamily C member 1 isoform X2 [Patella vulgata]